MFPYRRMPFHITALYIYTVINLLALFHVSLVVGDIVVITANNGTERISDTELDFAAPIPKYGVEGMVVVAQPEDACNPISAPPYPSQSSLKWFVLIRRYPCPLELKTRNAQKAGFDAAIIYSIGHGSPPFSGVRHNNNNFVTDIDIPAVIISEENGEKIKNNYLYDKGYVVIIYQNPPFDYNTYALCFAIIIGVCFVSPLLFMIVRCIRDSRRNRCHRLSSRHLKQLPTTKFKKGDKYDVCAICLEEFAEGDKLRILPCSHAYHTKCIDPWLTKSRHNCPICKRKVSSTASTSDSEGDSDSEHTRLLHSSNRRNIGGGTFTQTSYLPNAIQSRITDQSQLPSTSQNGNIPIPTDVAVICQDESEKQYDGIKKIQSISMPCETNSNEVTSSVEHYIVPQTHSMKVNGMVV